MQAIQELEKSWVPVSESNFGRDYTPYLLQVRHTQPNWNRSVARVDAKLST